MQKGLGIALLAVLLWWYLSEEGEIPESWQIQSTLPPPFGGLIVWSIYLIGGLLVVVRAPSRATLRLIFWLAVAGLLALAESFLR